MEFDLELRVTSLMINFDVVTRNCKTTDDLARMLSETLTFSKDPETGEDIALVHESIKNDFTQEYDEAYARPIIEELEQKAGRIFRRLKANPREVESAA